jgi:3-keto-disaccharide hydrolase
MQPLRPIPPRGASNLGNRISFLALTLCLAVGLVAVLATGASARVRTLLNDDFAGHARTTWADGSSHGGWVSVYNGYGTNSVKLDGTNVLAQSPQASKSLGETHASLVRTSKTFSSFDLTLRLKTVKQLRTPAPNPWETAWVLWHYSSDQSFYYLALKTNGWELAKVDASKKDPLGPACVWPQYSNCLYPGAQRYLVTQSSPAYPAGAWHTVRITQVGNVMNFWVDGAKLGSYTDNERPYSGGSIGLYNEDATVHFDDVVVKTTR